MPMFEYRCRACGVVFEELVRSSEDEEELICPSCGADGAERCVSACVVRVGAEGTNAAPMPPSGGCGSGGFS